MRFIDTKAFLKAVKLLRAREVSMRQLSKQIRISKVAAYRLIGRLQDLGLRIEVTRKRDGSRGPESDFYRLR